MSIGLPTMPSGTCVMDCLLAVVPSQANDPSMEGNFTGRIENSCFELLGHVAVFRDGAIPDLWSRVERRNTGSGVCEAARCDWVLSRGC